MRALIDLLHRAILSRKTSVSRRNFLGTRARRSPRTSTRRKLALESFEARLNLSTVLGDYDGIAGLETAQIEANSVTFTNTKTGDTLGVSIQDWNHVESIDLDGVPGLELLFTNLRTVNGIPQPSRASVVSLAKREVQTYDVGASNAQQIVDLDGIAGSEVLFTNLRTVNGLPAPTTALVLSASTNSLQSYDVGSPNAFQVVDLDGVAGPEVLFSNISVVNGHPQPAKATVLSQSKRKVQSYDVGSPNALVVSELDGSGGPEVLFTNIRTVNGVSQPVTATVLTASLGKIDSYDVGSPNAMQLSDLDGSAGNEVLFSNLQSIGGVPQPATATVLAQRNKLLQSYNLGPMNAMQIGDLDGVAGNEVLWTNLRTVNGVQQSASAKILTQATKQLVSYDVGSPNAFQVVDLDGTGGPEVVFTNISVVNNVPQQAQATILTPSTKQLQNYNVGTPNAYQVADLDGLGGPELLFTNVRSLNGVIQPATATILNQTNRLINSYAVGSPNAFQLANLNSTAGSEVLFTNIRTSNGIQQPVQAVILVPATKQVLTYSVGSPNAYQLLELDGVAGLDILFTNLSSLNGAPQPAQASILSLSANLVQQYSVGSPNAYQVADLDGVGAAEVLFTNLRSVNGVSQPAQASVISFPSSKVSQYSVGSPNAMQLVDLDGSLGSEVLFSNLVSVNDVGQLAEVTILTQRTASIQTFAVGRPNTMQVLELDGSAGFELLFTNLRSINGIPQTAEATVISGRTKQKQVYAIGQPNAIQVLDLDGQAGNEVLFTDIFALNGVQQLATAGVLTQRLAQFKSYSVGRPTTQTIVDLDGTGGREVLFTNVRSVNGVEQPAEATVLSATTQSVVSYQVGRPNDMQIANLDGVAGSEVLFTNLSSSNGVPQAARATVLTHRTQSTKTYEVGNASGFSLQNLDGIDGQEVLFVTPTSFKVLTARIDELYTYSTGAWTSFSIANLDGVDGDEIRIITATGKQQFINHRNRTLIKV